MYRVSNIVEKGTGFLYRVFWRCRSPVPIASELNVIGTVPFVFTSQIDCFRFGLSVAGIYYIELRLWNTTVQRLIVQRICNLRKVDK